MSYKGLEMTSQEAYMFSDTIPYNPEFDLEELKRIQAKLENYTSGRSQEGITSQEAEVFLDWVTFNARSYATSNIPESAMTASMAGQCAPTQYLNYNVLSKIGLDVRAFNISDCIGEIPMNSEDIKRIQNGWFDSIAIRHAVSLVKIPIIDDIGNTQLHEILLEPTFRQFCLKENCDSSKFTDPHWLEKRYVAPHPGYFMESNNLRRLGVSEEIAQKSENLARYIISKGYFYLNEENAKLYGDAFVRASKRLEFQNIPINMSGQDYIRNFESIPTKMITYLSKKDLQYTRLPSEIGKQKQGIFLRIKNFITSKFSRKKGNIMMLGEGCGEKMEVPTKSDQGREQFKLKPEQLKQFRGGETQILNGYKYQQNTNEQQYDESYRY